MKPAFEIIGAWKLPMCEPGWHWRRICWGWNLATPFIQLTGFFRFFIFYLIVYLTKSYHRCPYAWSRTYLVYHIHTMHANYWYIVHAVKYYTLVHSFCMFNQAFFQKLRSGKITIIIFPILNTHFIFSRWVYLMKALAMYRNC